ncbi:MAG: GNAT family N-acetyltransferase [Ilumatobacteraceae bacterium]
MHRLPERLDSSRLTLRQWVEADSPALTAAILASLDHLRPWMPWVATEPHTADERIGLINMWRTQWEQGGDLVVGIFIDGEVVGGSGLHRRRGPGVLEVGYWVHVDHIGKGIATEATAMLTTAAFTSTDVERVEIHHDKANIASEKIPRRLGFTLADETDDVVTSPGEIGIDCRWLMARRQWLDRTPTTQ